MQSPSELLLIQGVTAQLYQALLPHVCVLPAGTTINVNTASAAVLAALAPGLTLADGEALVQQRSRKPFDSVQAFRQSEQMAGRRVDETTLGVSTDYFLLAGEVHIGTGRVNLYSLFHRDPNGTPHLLMHCKDAF
jgi:general secretion pathway protein K